MLTPFILAVAVTVTACTAVALIPDRWTRWLDPYIGGEHTPSRRPLGADEKAWEEELS